MTTVSGNGKDRDKGGRFAPGKGGTATYFQDAGQPAISDKMGQENSCISLGMGPYGPGAMSSPGGFATRGPQGLSASEPAGKPPAGPGDGANISLIEEFQHRPQGGNGIKPRCGAQGNPGEGQLPQP